MNSRDLDTVKDVMNKVMEYLTVKPVSLEVKEENGKISCTFYVVPPVLDYQSIRQFSEYLDNAGEFEWYIIGHDNEKIGVNVVWKKSCGGDE